MINIDEVELMDTPEAHKHDYQHPYRKFDERGMVIIRTCTICGREKHTRFAKHNPQMPSIAPLSPFQDSM